MKIDKKGLDAADAYDSEWVGDRQGTSLETFNGRGRPVVGLFSHVPPGGNRLRWFGVMFAKGEWTTFADPKLPVENPASTDSASTADDEGSLSSKLQSEASALREQKQQQVTNWLLIHCKAAFSLKANG